MSIFARIKSNKSSTVLAQWLAVLCVLQMLLPMQAHSRLTTNEQGVPVVVCTLQGDKTVYLDLEGANADQASQGFSAAMQFSDLLNDLTPIQALPAPPTRVLGLILTGFMPVSHVAQPSLPEAGSRAPPSA